MKAKKAATAMMMSLTAVFPTMGAIVRESSPAGDATVENAMMFLVLVVVIMLAAVLDITTRRRQQPNR